MSKLISKHTTTLGCQVTVMDRTTPHDKMTHHEVILETAANNQRLQHDVFYVKRLAWRVNLELFNQFSGHSKEVFEQYSLLRALVLDVRALPNYNSNHIKKRGVE